jgi:AcrR family transcriptional regulator
MPFDCHGFARSTQRWYHEYDCLSELSCWERGVYAVGPAEIRPYVGLGFIFVQTEAYLAPRTSAQQARRQRIIEAAVKLGMEGGYEAVQMRDVANLADVALGTVYRYFTGKDHLLASAFLSWLERLKRALIENPSQAETACQRTKDVFETALKLTGGEPKLVGAVLTALASNDPDASSCQRQVAQVIQEMISAAIGDDYFADSEQRARIISHVWFSVLVGWVNEWSDLRSVREDLMLAIEILLPESHCPDNKIRDLVEDRRVISAIDGS